MLRWLWLCSSWFVFLNYRILTNKLEAIYRARQVSNNRNYEAHCSAWHHANVSAFTCPRPDFEINSITPQSTKRETEMQVGQVPHPESKASPLFLQAGLEPLPPDSLARGPARLLPFLLPYSHSSPSPHPTPTPSKSLNSTLLGLQRF